MNEEDYIRNEDGLIDIYPYEEDEADEDYKDLPDDEREEE